MATYQLLRHLRRYRPIASATCTIRLSQLIDPVVLHTPSSLPYPSNRSRTAVSDLFQSRTFFTRHVDNSELEGVGVDSIAVPELTTGVELVGKATDHMAACGISVHDSILPVRVVVSILDGYHELIGFPWWVVIASSTLALRLVLLPVLIFQLHKLKKIAQYFPKLPPPFPPPFSGKSYSKQISLFRKERKAVGCPSYLWHLSSFIIQVPCFFLWMISVRTMSLDNYPGFDCGGALWFRDLTAFPHGLSLSGVVFPLLIAGLHYTNVQISFMSPSLGKASGLLALSEYYKRYLDVLTIPVFFLGYFIPQGSLVYWVTNSSLTLFQQLALRHPAVQAKLGLLDKSNVISEESSVPNLLSGASNVRRQIPAKDLSPKELLSVSVLYLSRGEKERAIPLLQLALKKDPEYVRALITMGQTLLQKGLNAEAAEYLERAISKLCLASGQATVEDVDLLIVASQWAGVAYIRQGKNAEGLVHFGRLGDLEEPEDPASKAHYFDGLVLFASALFNEGRKAEASKYLRLAAAYSPAFKEYLEQCENDEDLVADLASSRREF